MGGWVVSWGTKMSKARGQQVFFWMATVVANWLLVMSSLMGYYLFIYPVYFVYCFNVYWYIYWFVYPKVYRWILWIVKREWTVTFLLESHSVHTPWAQGPLKYLESEGWAPNMFFFLEFHVYVTSSFKPGEDTKEEKSSTSTKAKTKETSSEEEADLPWFVAFILPLLVLPCFAYINCQLLVYRSSNRAVLCQEIQLSPRGGEQLIPVGHESGGSVDAPEKVPWPRQVWSRARPIKGDV